MAFLALELEKNPSLEIWLSKIIEGFSSTTDNPLGGAAHIFSILEAHSTSKESRLFIISTTWDNASTLWSIGFFGGIIAYISLNIAWILIIPIISAGTIYAFSDHFLALVTRTSLIKHKYKGEKRFYTAKQLIEHIGIRTIATTKYE